MSEGVVVDIYFLDAGDGLPWSASFEFDGWEIQKWFPEEAEARAGAKEICKRLGVPAIPKES